MKQKKIKKGPSGSGPVTGPVLEINNLKAEYYCEGGIIPALRGVDLRLNEGECIGVAGESGSGKSTLALSVLKLIDEGEGRVFGGNIVFNDRGGEKRVILSSLSKKEIQKIRGKHISLITQDPYSSFNPVIKLSDQFRETYRIHNPRSSESDYNKRIFGLLESVNLKPAREIADSYPHQLSGGMLQRASMAAALLNGPRVLIADEPTSSLDVTIQKTVIDTLKKLQNRFKLSTVFISHDLNLISSLADRVYILYAGKVVESGPVEEIFKNPRHPYTAALLEAIPKMGKKKGVKPIPGAPPRPGSIGKGCPFARRCKFTEDRCFKSEPSLVPSLSCEVACFRNL